MTYAGERIYLDADGHLMELPEFLRSHADSGVRDRLPDIDFASGVLDRFFADNMAELIGVDA